MNLVYAYAVRGWNQLKELLYVAGQECGKSESGGAMSVGRPHEGKTGESALVGRRVQGRYRIIREIGSGVYGTVWLAEDEATSHRVAVRFLPDGMTPAAGIA